jgi:hypothetical protein
MYKSLALISEEAHYINALWVTSRYFLREKQETSKSAVSTSKEFFFFWCCSTWCI